MTRATRTREIARAAVRADLAQAALELFCREGFDKVTVNEVAAAAGVSTSTFLRYFGSKEEAVLGALSECTAPLIDALRARPASEDDWTALSNALEQFLPVYLHDPAATLNLRQLIQSSPALDAGHRERQHSLQPQVSAALAERAGGSPDRDNLRVAVLAAAALSCLDIATDRWAASGGKLDLAELLRTTLAVLTPR